MHNHLKLLPSVCRIAMLLLFAGCSLSVYAQQRKVQNKPFIDERRFHYGFTVGLHDQGLSLTNNGFIDPATGAQWVAANDRHNFGFSVGVLGEWKLNPTFSLRLIPLRQQAHTLPQSGRRRTQLARHEVDLRGTAHRPQSECAALQQLSALRRGRTLADVRPDG